MRRIRIFPRDPISIGVLLLVAAAAPVFVASMLGYRRVLLDEPPIDLNRWIGLAFRPPLLFLPSIGWLFIFFGLVRKLRRPNRNDPPPQAGVK